MTPEQAVERLGTVLAHAWMVRTFLKHADEVQDDADMLEVPRTIFDYIRATEPAAQQSDAREFLHRIRGKLPKLRRAAEYFAAEYKRVSDHTNYLMASLSLSGCVREIDEILAAVEKDRPQMNTDEHR
jgi:CHAD domain-containing protein